MPYKHIPVMQREVIDFLNPRPGKIIVDGTMGGAGHARAIWEKISPTGTLIGIDEDQDAVHNAEKTLGNLSPNIHLVHDNFLHLPGILTKLTIDFVDGILLDLGLSLHHIESSRRGFSFARNEPLDMRMNTNLKETAADLLNTLDREHLIRLFREYGEEKWSGPIAEKIMAQRKTSGIETSGQLSDLVCRAVPLWVRKKRKIHPATKVFMALRIAVNRELEVLDEFMSNVVDVLNPGGRLCVLSYHSLEDRIIKTRTRELEKGCTCPPEFPTCICNKKPQVRRVTRKGVKPTEEEVKKNPMSRSARLRVLEKL
ncbi:MAG: 16S rRNA (cytosine(1402)-N(4))-methyltransferase RsmH [Desulfobacterales bacterium]